MPLPINDTDLFLIEDLSGASKKIAASKLRDNLALGTYDNFKLLVNKSNYTSAYVYAQNMQSSVAVDEWMLVERGGVTYKVSGQQIADYFPSYPASDCPGPILDINSDAGFVEPQVLTLASLDHVDELTPGDAVVMTDENCDVASYTPISSTITHVESNAKAGNWEQPGQPIPAYALHMVYAEDLQTLVATHDSGSKSTMIAYSQDQGETWNAVANGNRPSDSNMPSLTAGVAYGKGVFAAGGTSNRNFMWSDDGIVWNEGTNQSTTNAYSLNFINNKFYANLQSSIGNNALTFKSSEDGKTWNEEVIYTSSLLGAINIGRVGMAYGNGVYVITAATQTASVTDPSVALVSTDFVNWTEHNTGDVRIQKLTFGNGVFVGVAYTTNRKQIYTSQDGINWTAYTGPNNFMDVYFGGESFVAISSSNGTTNTIAVSYDGYNWTTENSVHADQQAVTAGGGYFYISTYNPNFTRSGSSGGFKLTVADNQDVKYFKPGDVVQGEMGDTFQIDPAAIYSFVGHVAYGDGVFVAGHGPNGSPSRKVFWWQDNTLIPGDNSNEWNEIRTSSSSETYRIHDVHYADGKFVAVGASGAVMWTTNPRSWANWNVLQPYNFTWQSVTYGNGQWVAVGATTYVMWATDPAGPWNRVSLNSTLKSRSWQRVTYADGKFVAVAWWGSGTEDQCIMYAEDPAGPWIGVEKDAVGLTNFPACYDITFGKGKFVAVSAKGGAKPEIFWSDDVANTWHEVQVPRSSGGTSAAMAITYDDELGVFCMVHENGTKQIQWATDPAGPWYEADTPSPSVEWGSITTGGGRFLCTGNSGNDRVMFSDFDTTKVVTRDVNEPSITVSGGQWSGSDGSGNPTGETIVTGPSKSGVGNFGGSSGNDITVTGSNHDWIDEDNREGRFFYLRNKTTRLGLAKIREKAIATAQAWAVDTGYNAEALVQHNGRYWLALSSNYNNSPDANDPLDWHDLGPTDSEQSTY